MPTIEISENTFRRLQRLAEPFVDSPESVIVRLLDQVPGAQGSSDQPRLQSPPPQATPRRASHGERTPADFFYSPIIQVLREAGGELSTQEAVDRVGRLVADRLNPVDFEPLASSGELRWRNTCRWARKHLVQQEVIDPRSPHGIWRLSGTQAAAG